MFDIAAALVGLVALSPVFLVSAIAIYLETGAPVLFRQTRIGRDGTPFEFLKFRSMRQGAENVPKTQAGGAAVTRVGRVLRRTNIDELPQFINILRGEMSLVGPRAPIPSQRELCARRSANGALHCAPGLTGLAQVHAYDGMPEVEKARWDGEYANSLSFATDMRIILKTFGYLTRRPPVY